MRSKYIFALLGFSLLADAALAADKTPKETPLKGNDCTFFSTIYDWQALDDHNLVIWAPSKREAYHVYLGMPSHDMRMAQTLGFVDGNGDGRLCGFGMDAIVTGESSFPSKSSISAMKKLDAAGIAQLEEKYKTKLSRDKKKKIPSEPSRETAQ